MDVEDRHVASEGLASGASGQNEKRSWERYSSCKRFLEDCSQHVAHHGIVRLHHAWKLYELDGSDGF